MLLKGNAVRGPGNGNFELRWLDYKPRKVKLRGKGGAGHSEPKFDPPCTEGRPDKKNALEDREGRLLGPPREKPVMPQLGLPRRKCGNSRRRLPAGTEAAKMAA